MGWHVEELEQHWVCALDSAADALTAIGKNTAAVPDADVAAIVSTVR
jgi:hypothetical protein